MINLQFGIGNPFTKNKFKNLFNRAKLLTTNKALEFEVTYHDYDLLQFIFVIATKTDHAGLIFTVGLFGYSAKIHLYDTRHWDYDKGEWETYDDDNTNS